MPSEFESEHEIGFAVGGHSAVGSVGSIDELDLYVLDDGTAFSFDGSSFSRSELLSRTGRTALGALARGLLAEGAEAVDFVWTGEVGAPYWLVHLERAEVGNRVAARLRARRSTDPGWGLSRRELDVVTLVVAGLSNAAIAECLVVSPRTITTHVDHVLRKSGAPNRGALAAIALDAGTVAVPLLNQVTEFQTLRVGRVVRAAGAAPSLTMSRGAQAHTSSGESIVIGSLVPLEGRARADGVEMIRGASLAIDELNRRGGIRGRSLRLLVESIDIDQPDSSEVTRATKRLLAGGVQAVTSGYILHQPRVVELVAAEGVPLLHASASSLIDDMVDADPQRFRGVFQVCPNDRQYAPHFVDYLTRLRDCGAWHPQSRQLVVAQQNVWETIDFGLDEAAVRAAANGWELIPLEVSDRYGSDDAWASIPRRVGAPAAIMLGSFFTGDHLRFLDAFAQAPTPTLLYSIYAPSVPQFRRTAGAFAEGLLWASTTGTYSDEIAHQFAFAYQSKFAAPPGRSMAGIAYDRINILAQAWAQVEDLTSLDEVSGSLLRTRYRGVNGAYSFTGSGHGTLALGSMSPDPSIAQAHTVFQLQSGRHVLVDPAPYASGPFVLPPWYSGAGVRNSARARLAAS